LYGALTSSESSASETVTLFLFVVGDVVEREATFGVVFGVGRPDGAGVLLEVVATAFAIGVAVGMAEAACP
jgi:hypothetical protein